MKLIWYVWKFFCDTAECVRKVFAERLPHLVAPWTQMTTHLSEALQTIGLATCGRPGTLALLSHSTTFATTPGGDQLQAISSDWTSFHLHHSCFNASTGSQRWTASLGPITPFNQALFM